MKKTYWAMATGLILALGLLASCSKSDDTTCDANGTNCTVNGGVIGSCTTPGIQCNVGNGTLGICNNSLQCVQNGNNGNNFCAGTGTCFIGGQQGSCINQQCIINGNNGGLGNNGYPYQQNNYYINYGGRNCTWKWSHYHGGWKKECYGRSGYGNRNRRY